MKKAFIICGVLASLTLQGFTTNDARKFLDEANQFCNISEAEQSESLKEFKANQEAQLKELLTGTVKPALEMLKKDLNGELPADELQFFENSLRNRSRQIKMTALLLGETTLSSYRKCLSNKNNSEEFCDKCFLSLLIHQAGAEVDIIGDDIIALITQLEIAGAIPSEVSQFIPKAAQ